MEEYTKEFEGNSAIGVCLANSVGKQVGEPTNGCSIERDDCDEQVHSEVPGAGCVAEVGNGDDSRSQAWWQVVEDGVEKEEGGGPG